MARVLVPLAPGFEEIEAVTILDVLRRAGVEAVAAHLAGSAAVTGSHGITLQSEVALSDALQDAFDLVVLPGGEPGVTHLGESAALMALLRRRHEEQQPIAAICAAPRLLALEGMLRQRATTSHPSVAETVRQGGARYTEERVVRDGHLLTSRGPGTALEFSLAILELLNLGEQATRLRRAMLVTSG